MSVAFQQFREDSNNMLHAFYRYTFTLVGAYTTERPKIGPTLPGLAPITDTANSITAIGNRP